MFSTFRGFDILHGCTTNMQSNFTLRHYFFRLLQCL